MVLLDTLNILRKDIDDNAVVIEVKVLLFQNQNDRQNNI